MFFDRGGEGIEFLGDLVDLLIDGFLASLVFSVLELILVSGICRLEDLDFLFSIFELFFSVLLQLGFFGNFGVHRSFELS